MTVVWGLALAVVLAGNGLILREVVTTRHDARAAYNVVRRAMAAAFLHAAPVRAVGWQEGRWATVADWTEPEEGCQ